MPPFIRCGNVASILELDDHLGQEYKVFQHAPSVRNKTPSFLFSTLVTFKSLGCSLNTSKTTSRGLLLVTSKLYVHDNQCIMTIIVL